MNTSSQTPSEEFMQSVSGVSTLAVVGEFVSFTRLCNDLGFLTNAITTLPLIGVQAYLANLLLVQNIIAFIADILAFLGIIRHVGGLWKEKRRLGLQGGKDFVTLLLQQDFSSEIVGVDVVVLQNLLSTILICEFTLDLRRRNTRAILNQSALEIPDFNLPSQVNPIRSIRSILGRFQERMIADMGERSDPVSIEGLNQLEGEPDPETA
ncbi:hypothetical protein Clacol_004700 [Clathrus columnatus]|uniref:Uncharacterized protein n=1 Tax=Clathrus columnatus TaxID=1419009 RepID=A0AAV5AB77_9AGAM|nr:hypothetical protein Clacol_004700 [Clathrus columnatus]